MVVPGLKDVVQGSTCATSSRPRVSACSSFSCFPDEPRKMRGLSIRSSRQQVGRARGRYRCALNDLAAIEAVDSTIPLDLRSGIDRATAILRRLPPSCCSPLCGSRDLLLPAGRRPANRVDLILMRGSEAVRQRPDSRFPSRP